MLGLPVKRLKNDYLHRKDERFMTIVVKKVPKAFRGIIKFLFKIKE